jgi:hypothetical protein
MHEAVDNLEAAIPTTDPAEVYAVTHKALASAIKVIARADDSSGIIGDACRRLLELHPTVAAAAQVPAGSLVDWMVRFQFDGDVDYFGIDPVAYAPALGNRMLGRRGPATARRVAVSMDPPALAIRSMPSAAVSMIFSSKPCGCRRWNHTDVRLAAASSPYRQTTRGCARTTTLTDDQRWDVAYTALRGMSPRPRSG